MAFGASVLCWYEHISRVASLVLCKNHRRWESAFKFVTRNRSIGICLFGHRHILIRLAFNFPIIVKKNNFL